MAPTILFNLTLPISMKKTYSVLQLVSNYTTKINYRSVKMYKRSLSNVKIFSKYNRMKFLNREMRKGNL